MSITVQRRSRARGAAGVFGHRAGVVLASLSLLGPVSCGRQPRPHIVLVLVDTLRADRLGSYANPRGLTPFLDQLSARGTVFLNAYSTSSFTGPSVASLFTSRYPSQHRIIHFHSKLADPEVTVAERFEQAGYVAGGFISNFFLSQSLGFAQGFGHWWVPHVPSVRGDAIGREAMSWIEGQQSSDSTRQLFLYLHYFEPHTPYEPVEPYRTRFQRPGDGSVGDRWPRLQPGPLDKAQIARLESLYDGEVASVDAELRLMFGELGRRGLLQNAIVAVTADHGEELGDHGDLGHGRSLYNEIVHVPLIFVVPGFPGGRVVPENVSLVDVAPTLLDLAGLAPEPRFEGRSLAPLLRPSRAGAIDRLLDFASRFGFRVPEPEVRPARDVILEQERQRPLDDPRRHSAGIIRDSTKLLIGAAGELEFYDLASDPHEASRNPNALDERAVALATELESAKARLRSRAHAGEEQPMDESTKEKLRALGYDPE